MKGLCGGMTVKKLICSVLAAAYATALVCMPAYAKISTQAEYSYTDGKLSVTGTISEARGLVTLTVLPEEVSPELLSVEAWQQNRYPAKTLRAAADGTYLATMIMPDWLESGVYKLYASDAEENAVFEFSHVNSEQAKDALAAVNSAEKAEMLGVLRDNAVNLALETARLDSDGDDMAAVVFTGRPEGGYTLPALMEELDRAKALCDLRADFTDGLVENKIALFGIDYAADYKNLSAEVKGQFAENIRNAALDSLPAFDLVMQGFIMAQVTASASYTGIQAAIINNSDYLEIDLSDYNMLSGYEKNQLFAAFEKANVTLFSELKPTFEQLAAAAAEKSDNSAGSSSGSSGGYSENFNVGYGDNFSAGQTPAPEPGQIVSSGDFSDMSGHWANAMVADLKARGIVSGMDDGSFQPDRQVTRAEFTSMVVKALGISVETYSGQFTDVSDGDWFAPYVAAAVNAGLVSGYGDYFAPNAFITREDGTTIMYRALEGNGRAPQGVFSFSDSGDISEYAKAAVGAMAAQKLVQGADGQFRPKDNTTRAEAAAMIYSMLNYLENGAESGTDTESGTDAESDTDTSEAAELKETIAALTGVEVQLPAGDDQTVTKAQFITAAVALFNSGAYDEQQLSFTDVPSDSELYPVLARAVAMGMVPDGAAFNPENPVTLAACARILSTAAGYGVKAELMGAADSDYISAATDAGIFKNISTGTGRLTVRDALHALWNTLNADMLTMRAVGNNVEYTAEKGKTVLSELYDVYYVDGVFNANTYTAMGESESAGSSGYGEIGGQRFEEAASVDNSLLGYYVRGYYREEDSGNVLIYVLPKDNEVLTLKAEDAMYSPSDRVIEYEERTIKKARLDYGFEVIYNGHTWNDFGDSLIPGNGMVTLVDNDQDGRYEIVSITEYYYMTVSAVNKYYMTISAANNSEKSLDLSSEECISTVTNAEGEIRSIADITAGSTLAVKASKNRMLVDILILENSVSGTVRSLYADSIQIDDETYDVDPDFMEENANALRVGNAYDFVTGVYGEIVSLYTTGGIYRYGYLIKAGSEDEFGLDMWVKLFSETGAHETLALAEKVSLNDERATYGEVFEEISEDGEVIPQLIRYHTDADGRLDRLDTAETVVSARFTSDVNPDDSLMRYMFSGTINYRQQIFYPSFNVAKSIVFKIPTNLTELEDFAIGYTFMDGNYSSDVLSVYDIDASGSAGAIVYTTDSSTLTMNSASRVMMVEEVVQTVDEDGIPCTKIYGWEKGSFAEYILDDNITVTKNGVAAELAGGDLIRFAENGGRIRQLVVDFDAETMCANTESDVAPFNQKSSIWQYQAGKVYSMDNGYVYLSGEKDSDSYDFTFQNLINVKIPDMLVVYDFETKTIRPGDTSYIRSYLSDGNNAVYMVVQQHYMSSQTGYIYIGAE